MKPGGMLAYITCSILRDENEGQVASFLAAHPGFAALDPKTTWAEHFPGATEPHFGDLGLTLTPYRTDTDGFFISLLSAP